MSPVHLPGRRFVPVLSVFLAVSVHACASVPRPGDSQAGDVPGSRSRCMMVLLGDDGDGSFYVAAAGELVEPNDDQAAGPRCAWLPVPGFVAFEHDGGAYVFLLDTYAPRLHFEDDPDRGLLLNGDLLVADVAAVAVRDGADAFTPAELQAMRGVRLGGDAAADIAFLRQLTPPATVVVDASAYNDTLPRPVAAAIAAVRPAGLVIDGLGNYPDLVAGARGLRMLATGEAFEPLLPLLPELEVLLLTGEDHAVDARLLRRAGSLRRLLLLGTVTNVEALGDLRSLQSLVVLWEGRHDLRPLARLRSLEYLALLADSLRDISAVASLTDLTDLWLLNVGRLQELAGVDRLAALPRLRRVVVDEDVLAADSANWELLRRARPDVAVVGWGVCVGSWLILLVLPVGAGAAFLMRPRRRPPQ
jgi:hypothetical protein